MAGVWIATSDPARADGLSRWLQAVIIAVLAFYFGNGDAAWARRRARIAEMARADASAALVAQEEELTRLEERVRLASSVITHLQKKIQERATPTRDDDDRA